MRRSVLSVAGASVAGLIAIGIIATRPDGMIIETSTSSAPQQSEDAGTQQCPEDAGRSESTGPGVTESPSDTAREDQSSRADAPSRADRGQTLERERSEAIQRSRASLEESHGERAAVTVSFERSVSRDAALELLWQHEAEITALVYGLPGRNSFWTMEEPSNGSAESLAEADAKIRARLTQLAQETERLVAGAPASSAAQDALNDARDLHRQLDSSAGMPVIAVYAQAPVHSARSLAQHTNVSAVGAVRVGCRPQSPVMSLEALDSFANAENAEPAPDGAPSFPSPTPEG